SMQRAATPGRQGQGWQMLVIAVVLAASEVLNWGSGCSDWQGDKFRHGLPAHLCLLVHSFD
ncbi:hypothetical protein, partial [Actinoplanes sp. DH11]|uniref:hypothetical protein n=1 Tax=Actinoplanes sp. DH11 TaxID=2857011 RepID=UPI001E294FC7